MVKVEMHTDFNRREKFFCIVRENKCEDTDENNIITIKKLKEVLAAIDVLFEKPEKEIRIYGGCIDVKPCSSEKEDEIDPPIMDGLLVTHIGVKTLTVECKNYSGQKRTYKTAQLNSSYIYDGKTWFNNTIDEIRISIKG